jgi:hypothetical protein
VSRVWPLTLAVACAPVDELTAEEFAVEFESRWCDLAQSCGTPCTDGTVVPTPTAGGTGCIYDEDAGRECLEGGWTCSPTYDGTSSPAPAYACDRVFVCPTYL